MIPTGRSNSNYQESPGRLSREIVVVVVPCSRFHQTETVQPIPFSNSVPIPLCPLAQRLNLVDLFRNRLRPNVMPRGSNQSIILDTKADTTKTVVHPFGILGKVNSRLDREYHSRFEDA